MSLGVLGPRTILGELYRSLGQSDEAVAVYEGILRIDGEDFGANKALAEIHNERGECRKAIPHLAAWAEGEPSSSQYTILANAYTQCENLNKAIRAYGRAISLDAANERAHFGLALAYDAQGRILEAIREFRIVIEIST